MDLHAGNIVTSGRDCKLKYWELEVEQEGESKTAGGGGTGVAGLHVVSRSGLRWERRLPLSAWCDTRAGGASTCARA